MFEKWKAAAKKAAFNLHWTCAHCGGEIFDGGYFCKDCLKRLPFVGESICSHCGRKTVSPREYCDTCAGRLTAFDTARSVFLYEGVAAELVKKFKYGNARYLAEVFAPFLAEVYKTMPTADAVISVPMYKKDEKKRGYNQTVLLAEAFSRLTGVKHVFAAEKRKTAEKQVGLGRASLLKNSENAFRIADKKAVAGKNILILDDVTTTGATANALADALKKSGAAKVYVLTVASVAFAGETENQRESAPLSEKE